MRSDMRDVLKGQEAIVLLLVAAWLSPISLTAEPRPTVGFATSDSRFLAGGSEVTGHVTVFEGESVTSGHLPTRLNLQDGWRFLVGIGSRVQISRTALQLDGGPSTLSPPVRANEPFTPRVYESSAATAIPRRPSTFHEPMPPRSRWRAERSRWSARMGKRSGRWQPARWPRLPTRETMFGSTRPMRPSRSERFRQNRSSTLANLVS